MSGGELQIGSRVGFATEDGSYFFGTVVARDAGGFRLRAVPLDVAVDNPGGGEAQERQFVMRPCKLTGSACDFPSCTVCFVPPARRIEPDPHDDDTCEFAEQEREKLRDEVNDVVWWLARRGFQSDARRPLLDTVRAAVSPGLAAEVARLRKTVDAVRVLHTRVERRDNLGRPEAVCGGCSDGWGDAHGWPCPTVQVLDEETAA